MYIKRVYNNNVVMVDDAGTERIAVGKGIAFGRKRGDVVDSASFEKVFTLDDPTQLSRLERLIKGIPSEYLLIAEDIVSMLRRESASVIDDNVLIALTDHISMALEREQAGIICDNPLLFEIKRFYGREFEFALKAREIIRGHLGIEISEAEVGFIALHIVNATMKQRADHLMLSIKMINGILNTVSETFGITYDEGSVQYERFLRHLQFFSQRVLDKSIAQSEDTFLFHLGKDQYPDALECTERIGAHIEQEYGCVVSDAEKGYLVYHIANLVHAPHADASGESSVAAGDQQKGA
ncbi:MAG: PRD domain-containing protein [Collinsella intestinalis]|uniref:PRD domain-containing protein n=1 Tax=Collinsella intestinalis TaxID=147207 RepID=A0A943BNZ4_9ACTN|nr:PRD domain-containing protein [Collinsella intestinalis]